MLSCLGSAEEQLPSVPELIPVHHLEGPSCPLCNSAAYVHEISLERWRPWTPYAVFTPALIVPQETYLPESQLPHATNGSTSTSQGVRGECTGLNPQAQRCLFHPSLDGQAMPNDRK